MPWKLTGLDMERVIKALSLTPPSAAETIFFFGVRGAVPKNSSPYLAVLDGSKPTNGENMRCALGQWWPHDKLESASKIAVYLGSTVPTDRYVEAASDRGGQGTNLLLPGLYTFIRGQHRAGTPTGHAAFRELGDKLICRTADDGLYEPDSDFVGIDEPCDNIHAAWSVASSKAPWGDDGYSSAGCQVVAGKPGEGAWAAFKAKGYEKGLGVYRYLLLPSSNWVHLVTTGEPAVVIGSRGDRAKAVQQALIDRGLLAGSADGIFGCKSGLALVKFQRARPELPASAICTATVAGLLGVVGW
ncbi:peptidoglycan-binding protein [Armatimonas sp.]|uniref:peptidoglycan-binding domain-containing protein n=1 Tax=Armatimonas sp. TaxID=1872638 RepID=UPI00374DF149